MKGLDFLEDLTEQEESTVQGGRTDLVLGGQRIQVTGNPTNSFGAYFSFPLALFFQSTGGFFSFDGTANNGLLFRVARGSDQLTNGYFSGNLSTRLGHPGDFGLAGDLNLPRVPNIPFDGLAFA